MKDTANGTFRHFSPCRSRNTAHTNRGASPCSERGGRLPPHLGSRQRLPGPAAGTRLALPTPHTGPRGRPRCRPPAQAGAGRGAGPGPTGPWRDQVAPSRRPNPRHLLEAAAGAWRCPPPLRKARVPPPCAAPWLRAAPQPRRPAEVSRGRPRRHRAPRAGGGTGRSSSPHRVALPAPQSACAAAGRHYGREAGTHPQPSRHAGRRGAVNTVSRPPARERPHG